MDKEKELEKLFRIFVDDDIESLRGDPIMDEAIDELERISQDEKIIELYNAEKIGIEKGIEREKIQIAHNMLDKNMDISIISELTGLSIKQIEEL